MLHVVYFHWHPEEASVRATELRAAGIEVQVVSSEVSGMRSALRNASPDVVVIDLSRLPSHGREIGVWLTETKSTALIPVIFVDGQESKIELTRNRIPSATFCSWSKLPTTIRKVTSVPRSKRSMPARVIASGPANAVGYSGKPLWKKLGIRAGQRMAILHEPDGFRELLTDLPNGVEIKSTLTARSQLLIWFPRTAAELQNRIAAIVAKLPERGVWIAWPKQASGIKTNVTQTLIREVALGHGLMDFKICAIDERYSGMQFARQRQS